MHDRKGHDYDRGEIPYFNFRGSADWGIEPWIGAMVRANDKIKRLQKYAKDGVLKNEGVEDSLLDLAVYSIIALILWREEQPKKRRCVAVLPPDKRQCPHYALSGVLQCENHYAQP